MLRHVEFLQVVILVLFVRDFLYFLVLALIVRLLADRGEEIAPLHFCRLSFLLPDDGHRNIRQEEEQVDGRPCPLLVEQSRVRPGVVRARLHGYGSAGEVLIVQLVPPLERIHVFPLRWDHGAVFFERLPEELADGYRQLEQPWDGS